MGGTRAAFLLRRVVLIALVLVGAWGAMPPLAHALPELKVGTGVAVTPAQAEAFYQAQGLASPAWTEDPELKALAAALGNDADRIHAYVRNEIEVVPLFGVKAGARGCYIDKACTPFDQAQLMVELLRSAGISASYQLGTITLNGTQFNQWLGVTNAAAARKLLADAGWPATVTGTTTVTSVTMSHLWVRATIGGVTYAFDPGFKPHAVRSGIDVGTAMGFNATTFWSGALSGSLTGTNQVSNLNRNAIRNSLNGYATSLLNHMQATAALLNGSIENIVGDRTPVPHAGGALRQTTLPYQAGLAASFAGDLPEALRTRITMRFGSLNAAGTGQTNTVNWLLDEIYGRQIVFEFTDKNPLPPTASQFRLMLGEVPVTGWLNGTIAGAAVSINHAYAAGAGLGIVDGTYMDRTVNLDGQTTGSMQVFIAGGRPSSDLAAYQERTHSGRSANTMFQKADGQENLPWYQPQQISQRRRMGTSFLGQFADMTELVGGVAGAVVLVHDVIGCVTVTPTFSTVPAPVATSYVLSMEPAISTVSKTAVASQNQVVAQTVAMLASALEGSVAQQVADSIYPVSAVAQLDWANYGPSSAADRWFYHATAANWGTVSAQILNDFDGRSPMRNAAAAYVNAGYTVFIPRSSSLGPAPARMLWCRPQPLPNAPTCDTIGPDRAGAFIAIHPVTGAIAHISPRQYTLAKGGGGTADVETDAQKIFGIGEDFLEKQFTARAEAGKVDLKTGLLEYTAPADLVVGSGGYPYSLTFQRSYRSGSYNSLNDLVGDQQAFFTPSRDRLFGDSGWRSNLTHYAAISAEGTSALGQDDPRAAVQTLVAIRALLSVMGPGTTANETLQRQIVGAIAAFWWTETILQNTITVSQGHASRSFTRLHSGAYVARGSAETAELFGSRSIVIPLYGQHRWWYRFCVRVTGAQREVSFYGLWDAGYASCVGPPQPGDRFSGQLGNQPNMQFVRQVFPFGVTVTWDGSTLSNSLGRALTIAGVTPEGFGGTLTSSAGQSVTFTQVPSLGGYGSALTATYGAGLGSWTWIDDTLGFDVRPPSTPLAAMLSYDYVPGSFGTVAAMRDAVGSTTAYNIGGGRVSSVVNPLGHATRTWHDRFGNVVAVEDALGRTSRTEYDNLRRKVREVAPEGNAVAYTYDVRSNVLTTRRTPKPGSTLAPTVTSATWDSLCNVKLTETDALNRTTTSVINQATCLVTSVRQPALGTQVPTTSFVYNGVGRMTQKTDPTGLVTQINYDSLANPTAVIVNPGAAPNLAITTLFTYDAAGNITSVTDPRGKIHSGTYDALRRLTQYNAPAGTGASTTWTYDADGLITQISRANGAAPAVTRYTYWPTGRVRTMTDPDGQVTRYDYDVAGRPTFTTDPELRRTLKVYNAAGEVIEERRAVGTPVEQAYARFTYTLNGKQASVADARGNQTGYAYDGFDRPTRTTFPNATWEEMSYDAVDNVTAKRTRAAQIVTNSYDALNRQVTHSVPQPGTTPAIVTTTTYDLAGRVLTVSDTTGQGLTYTLDSAKRVVSVGQTAPNITGTRTVSYGLDAAGNKTRLTWPDGYSVSYDYDDLNRMTVVRESGTFVLATYVHDPLSRRTSLVYGNGTTQGYAWSRAGDLTSHTHTLSGTANTWTLGYSKAHQLVSEAASNAAWGHVASVDETTSYGAANSLNQYVTVTQGASPAVTLTHDANGNLTGEGTWTFAYDAENRLRTATRAGTAATYLYDPAGRRQAKVVNGVVTSFLSDGAEEIAEYTGAGALLRRYVPGPGTDQPIAMITPAGAGQTRSYFHVNRQGSTVAMSNDAGTVSEGPYTYDAYGQGTSSAGVPFKYTGRRLDPETGLYYYRARYYSAALGRFLQTDPVGYADQMNPYAYSWNDPLNRIDPFGERSYLISRPLGNNIPANHMFVIVVDDKTGKVVRRYSYGPQGGFWNRGQLVSQTGSRSDTDKGDAAATKAFLEDQQTAAAEGIIAEPIDASDEAVMRSGDSVDSALGTIEDPGPVPYETLPDSDSVGANSNSAAYAVADRAVKSENPKATQRSPRGTVNPGSAKHVRIPGGPCRGTRIGNRKSGSIC